MGQVGTSPFTTKTDLYTPIRDRSQQSTNLSNEIELTKTDHHPTSSTSQRSSTLR